MDRGGSFIKLEPLMLYIAVHELTHVVRFSNGHSDFDAPEAEKDQEERKVNTFTQNILSSNTDRGVRLVMDCFNKRYDIDAIGRN
jgi:Zn-dependent peptidase ImmA (M78 family)